MATELKGLINDLIQTEEFNAFFDKCTTEVSKKNLFRRTAREYEKSKKLEPKSISSSDIRTQYIEARLKSGKEINTTSKKDTKITKEEVYSKMVRVVKRSGQGVPYHFFGINLTHKEFIDELITEGKLKRVKYHGNLMVVLTEGYVPEEDTNKKSLMFIRYYLGHSNIFGKLPTTFFDKKYPGKSQREILMLDQKESYDAWLEENKEKIEITKNL